MTLRKFLCVSQVAACISLAGFAPQAVYAGEGVSNADALPVSRRPRSEILALGTQYLRPDLTRGIVNDYRDLLAWILNIKLTDAQCDSYERRMIARWPSLLGYDVDEITGGGKLAAEIRAMPPAQLRVTYDQLHERVLKNLHDMVGGATMIGMYKVVTDDDRRDAQWLLAIYQDQHPESVAPMPAMPDVPGANPKPVEQRGSVEPASDVILVNGATPLKQSSVDAMSEILCFLSAKSHNAQYLPASSEFRTLFARKLAEEYPSYTPDQQAALAKLPAYWNALSSNWDRLKESDRATTVAQWKPLLDALQANAPAQNLSSADQTALAAMNDQLTRTQDQLTQLRALQQMDMNQQLQFKRLELMQQMQQQQITMMSNIARSSHETNMRIIENMGPTRHPWD